MREIKFRAWNPNAEKLVYNNEDNMADYQDGWFINPVELVNTLLSTETYDTNGFIWEQFTGLHDKNGVEIYEGDILKATLQDEDYIKDFPNGIKYFVRWDNSTTGWTLIDIEDYDDEQFFDEAFEYEVIGNIHEGVKENE